MVIKGKRNRVRKRLNTKKNNIRDKRSKKILNTQNFVRSPGKQKGGSRGSREGLDLSLALPATSAVVNAQSIVDKLPGRSEGSGITVKRILGSGAEGKVFLASMVGEEQEVTLKVITSKPSQVITKDDAMVKTDSEYKILKQLMTGQDERKKNIVNLIKRGRGQDYLYWLGDNFSHYGAFLMEYANHRTLEFFIKSTLIEKYQDDLPIDAFEISSYFYDVIMGIRCCHDAHILHRDVKPDNILLHQQSDGRMIAKLADFGLSARWGQRLESEFAPCYTDEIPHGEDGTPYYKPPESTYPPVNKKDLSDKSLRQIVYIAGSVGILDGDEMIDYLFTVLSDQEKAKEEIIAKLVDQGGTQSGIGLKSDIWALGVILYRLFKLEYPFKSSTGTRPDLYNEIRKGCVNALHDHEHVRPAIRLKKHDRLYELLTAVNGMINGYLKVDYNQRSSTNDDEYTMDFIKLVEEDREKPGDAGAVVAPPIATRKAVAPASSIQDLEPEPEPDQDSISSEFSDTVYEPAFDDGVEPRPDPLPSKINVKWKKDMILTGYTNGVDCHIYLLDDSPEYLGVQKIDPFSFKGTRMILGRDPIDEQIYSRWSIFKPGEGEPVALYKGDGFPDESGQWEDQRGATIDGLSVTAVRIEVERLRSDE